MRWGAGAKFSQNGRTRLLMALVWLRVYPTYEVGGFFFSLNKGNAQRGVVDAFPDVRLVIDAKEQRVRRQ